MTSGKMQHRTGVLVWSVGAQVTLTPEPAFQLPETSRDWGFHTVCPGLPQVRSSRQEAGEYASRRHGSDVEHLTPSTFGAPSEAQQTVGRMDARMQVRESSAHLTSLLPSTGDVCATVSGNRSEVPGGEELQMPEDAISQCQHRPSHPAPVRPAEDRPPGATV